MGAWRNALALHTPNGAPILDELSEADSQRISAEFGVGPHGPWMKMEQCENPLFTGVHKRPGRARMSCDSIDELSTRLHPDLIQGRVHSGTPGYPIARIGIVGTT
jgi:hypothetical protein